jgi:hypothetical protein
VYRIFDADVGRYFRMFTLFLLEDTRVQVCKRTEKEAQCVLTDDMELPI